jgi:hypothetical protein
MKRLLVTLIYLHVLQLHPDAQSLLNRTTGSGLTIKWPDDYPAPSGPTPYCIFFLEYGDGYFTNTQSSLPYKYKNSGTYRSLLRTAVMYDTIKRPPLTAKLSDNFSGVFGNTTQNILNGRKILLTPSAPDLMPNEGMAFAITYRLPVGKSGKIEVKYDASGSNAFLPITSLTQSTTYGGETVEMIRKHNGESPELDVNRRIIRFQTQTLNDTNERNIFFSLDANDVANINSHIQTARITVTLTSSGFTETYTLDLAIRFEGPHDPNYLLSLPECIEYPSAGRGVIYALHFENTGKGPVKDSIKTVIQLPEGIDYGKIVIGQIRLGEAYNAGILVKAADGDVPEVLIKDGLIISHHIKNKQLIIILREDHDDVATRSKNLLEGKYDGTMIPLEKRVGEIKFKVFVTEDAGRFLIGWAGVNFDKEQAMPTFPSFTYFTKKCPCDCLKPPPKKKRIYK